MAAEYTPASTRLRRLSTRLSDLRDETDDDTLSAGFLLVATVRAPLFRWWPHSPVWPYRLRYSSSSTPAVRPIIALFYTDDLRVGPLLLGGLGLLVIVQLRRLEVRRDTPAADAICSTVVASYPFSENNRMASWGQVSATLHSLDPPPRTADTLRRACAVCGAED